MKRFLTILKFALLLFLVVVLPIYIYRQYPEWVDQFRTLEGVNAFLSQYKTISIFVYIGLQISQIAISVIPGQFIQFAGGYAYGFWFGYLYSVIGIGMGTAMTFFLARILGRDAMHMLFGEERISKFVNQLNSKRAISILFVLFIIPGIPKDLITYAAGVSEFRLRPYLILSMVGRSPALMGTIMMGSMLNKGSYMGLVILGFLTVVVFIVLFLKRHALTKLVDRIYRWYLKASLK